MKLHTEKLHTAIIVKMAKLKIGIKDAPISNASLHRLSKGDVLKLPLLIKCFEWLEVDANTYIY